MGQAIDGGPYGGTNGQRQPQHPNSRNNNNHRSVEQQQRSDRMMGTMGAGGSGFMQDNYYDRGPSGNPRRRRRSDDNRGNGFMDERDYYERSNRRIQHGNGPRSRGGGAVSGRDMDGHYSQGYKQGFQQAGYDTRTGGGGGGQRLPPRDDYRNHRLGAQQLYQGFEDQNYGGSQHHFSLAPGERPRRGGGGNNMRQQNFSQGFDDGFGGAHAQQFDEYSQDMMGGPRGPQQYGFGRGPRPPNRGPYRNPNGPSTGGNRSGFDGPINHD